MKRMFCKIVAVMLAVMCMPAVVRAGDEPDGKWTFNGFSGGMMLHIGYVGGGTAALYSPSGIPLPAQKMNGVPYGIGGCAKVYFGEHLRVGTEGYATYLVYGDNASRFGIGWGGLLLVACGEHTSICRGDGRRRCGNKCYAPVAGTGRFRNGTDRVVPKVRFYGSDTVYWNGIGGKSEVKAYL